METIKKASYQGYIWYSDSTQPIVLNNEEFGAVLDEQKNPFIIEGQLWNEAEHESISIKFADGKYYVEIMPISAEELNKNESDIETYIAHRMPGVAGLRFFRRWAAKPDPYCSEFDVLEPVNMAFIGFKQKNKEE